MRAGSASAIRTFCPSWPRDRSLPRWRSQRSECCRTATPHDVRRLMARNTLRARWCQWAEERVPLFRKSASFGADQSRGLVFISGQFGESSPAHGWRPQRGRARPKPGPAGAACEGRSCLSTEHAKLQRMRWCSAWCPYDPKSGETLSESKSQPRTVGAADNEFLGYHPAHSLARKRCPFVEDIVHAQIDLRVSEHPPGLAEVVLQCEVREERRWHIIDVEVQRPRADYSRVVYRPAAEIPQVECRRDRTQVITHCAEDRPVRSGIFPCPVCSRCIDTGSRQLAYIFARRRR